MTLKRPLAELVTALGVERADALHLEARAWLVVLADYLGPDALRELEAGVRGAEARGPLRSHGTA